MRHVILAARKTQDPGTAERVSGDRIAWRLPRSAHIPLRLRRRRGHSSRLLSIDLLALAFALGVSAASASAAHASVGPWGWTIAYGVTTIAVLGGRGSYRFRLRTSPLDHIGQALTSAAVAAMAVITARVLVDPSPHAAGEVVRSWAFASTYIGAARVALSVYENRAQNRGLNTLIIGAGRVGQLVAHRLLARPEMGLRPIGFLDKEPKSGDGMLPVLGASWDLEDVVQREQVDHVIVSFSRAPNEVLLGIVRRCRGLGIEVSLVPRLFEEVSNRVAVEHLGGVALLRIDQADPRGWQFDLKYALDRVIALLVVLALSPLFLVLVLAVRLSSRGPIFFVQDRIGLDGREFRMLKFRTMRMGEPGEEQDAAWAARILGEEAELPAVSGDDDRRTAVGRLMRRWSLDELPQLLNVLRGDMSLVGPRPERTGYVRAFEQHVYRYGDRHRVKSGLTGWAQVNGLRGETALDDRVEWDNYYVENWTPWLDIKILLLTPMAVLQGQGAV